MVTEVWMVRHTAVDVPQGTCYGRSDVALCESFAEEAAAVRRALDGVGFDAAWCSPLGRCMRLAEACGYGGALRDDRLLELDFGEWEGRRFDEIDDPALGRWYDDWLHERPTGGENFAEQSARVAEFLEELRVWSQKGTEDAGSREELRGETVADLPVSPADRSLAGGEFPTRRVLVFTHGGVMAAAGIHAGLWKAEEAFSHVPHYGSIIKIYL